MALWQRLSMTRGLRPVNNTLLVLWVDEAEEPVESSSVVVNSTSRTIGIVGHRVSKVSFAEAEDALSVKITWVEFFSASAVGLEVALRHGVPALAGTKRSVR